MTYYMLPTRNLLKYEDIDGLKVKEWIKIYPTNMNQKKPGMVTNNRQNIFQSKKYVQGQRGSLQNDRGVDSLKEHNNPKCLCIQ